jgi:hypothetical protein
VPTHLPHLTTCWLVHQMGVPWYVFVCGGLCCLSHQPSLTHEPSSTLYVMCSEVIVHASLICVNCFAAYRLARVARLSSGSRHCHSMAVVEGEEGEEVAARAVV